MDSLNSIVKFDFIDLGCGDGGSLDHCQRRFRAKGLGLEFKIERVEEAQAKGYKAMQADLAKPLPFADKSISFVTALDFLEHLDTIDIALATLREAARVAKDFIFIKHPSFEHLDYIESLGVRPYWAHWEGHKALVTLAQFQQECKGFGAHKVTIVPKGPISDSGAKEMLPLSAPIDQHDYDADKHGPKPQAEFDREIYRQFEIFIALRRYSFFEWRRLLMRRA